MATPTQTQPYPGGNPYQGAPSTAGPPPAQQQTGYGAEPRSLPSGQGQYGQSHGGYNFEKYCIIHLNIMQ